MRIAVCGPDRNLVISELEKTLNVTVKKPWETNDESIIDYAAETYKYDNEHNVIFDGSAFDFLSKKLDSGVDEVYEQIALCSLNNLDYIIVITSNMDSKSLKVYEYYAELLPSAFKLYSSPEDVKI